MLKADDVVVLDNLGPHKSKAVRGAVRAVGARLVFLPKYSPDLNPIEQVFAKLEGESRKAKPRTIDAICDAIRQTLTRLTPNECPNYLQNAGYAPSQMQHAPSEETARSRRLHRVLQFHRVRRAEGALSR